MHVGQRLADRLARALLVLGVQEGEQEADRDRLDLRLPQRVHGLLQALLVERLELALGAHALAHAEAQLARHERRRPVLLEVVQVRPVLAPDLEHVAEAGRRHQRGARAAPLEQRVGGHGHAVREGARFADLRRLQRGQHALGLVAGRRRDLGRQHLPVDERDEIGERPADVDAEPQLAQWNTARSAGRSSPASSGRSSPRSTLAVSRAIATATSVTSSDAST